VTELRHYHGAILHDHDGGDAPHDHGQPGRAGITGKQLIAAAAILAGLFIAWHVVLAAAKIAGNEQAKNSPPVSCQLLGGHWTIWDGWVCG
jgi:hypothetical protein